MTASTSTCAGARSLRLHSLPFLLLFLSVALLCTVAHADTISLPLCGEKHGYAGELNDHYLIPIETAPADGEAIVLVARSFSANPGALLENWLYFNATYHISEGPEFTRSSDRNGILVLPNVAANTEIEVRVVKVRPDGPVPFTFFSFFANKPVCHVGVSPANTFISPVPHLLPGTSKPVTMYFWTTLPSNLNAITVGIDADGHTAQPFQVMGKDGTWQAHTATDLIQSSGGSGITFSFSPTRDDTASAYCFTSVSVSYATASGQTAAPGAPGQPSGGGTPTAPPGTAPTDAPTAAPAASTSMGLLQRLVWVGLLCFVAWQAAQSVYNYRVLGKRDVMEIIPCAETVAAGARGVQLAASRGLGRTQRRTDGYDSVQSMNDPYA